MNGHGRTVLVVDDEPDVLALISDLLQELVPCVVISAASPAAAIEAAKDRKLGALVTDFQMPGMNGIELAANLGRTRPGLKVVLFTAFADSKIGAVALQEGVLHAVCRKGADPQALVDLVRGFLSGKG